MLFLNPLLIAGDGHITGLLGAWFYNLVSDRAGGLIYCLDARDSGKDVE